jgi:hypothetical protein
MKPRLGFALAAALIAIVLIAVLVTGGLFASNQEASATGAEVLDQKAFVYAERAALVAMGQWTCPECDAIPIGSVIIRSPASSPPLESTVFITRLDSALFLVTGEGRVSSGGAVRASRRVSIAVRTSRDSLGVVRAARIDGEAWAAAYRM